MLFRLGLSVVEVDIHIYRRSNTRYCTPFARRGDTPVVRGASQCCSPVVMTPERERIGTYNGIRGQRISLAAGPELRRVGSYLPAFGFV